MSSNGDNNDDDQHGGSNSGCTTSSKKDCTSCEQSNNVENITKGIDSVAVLDNMLCANCGKEGNSDKMNICNKCKSVKYCNAACKKKHRTKHKKACERRVAKLHNEQLFKDPPPHEECPICFQPFLGEDDSETLRTCCGKMICIGCIYAIEMSEEGADLCPFCRTPDASSREESIQRIKALMEAGNGDAYDLFAGWYDDGKRGLPQDRKKAIELYLKAGELGCAAGYYNLGVNYDQGKGIEVDKKKAKHYYELAAMMGDSDARKNVGYEEWDLGNYDRAMKHWIIAAKAGETTSLDNVKAGYMSGLGLVTKDEYANTLRAYHQRQKEMKSEMRDKAAATRIARKAHILKA